MKYLKKFEKKKGNYLTKEDQPDDTFNEYLYDKAFGDIFYVCSQCDSYKLTPRSARGFEPPIWKCDDCGHINFAPASISPDRYKKYIEDKELKKNIKKYNV